MKTVTLCASALLFVSALVTACSSDDGKGSGSSSSGGSSSGATSSGSSGTSSGQTTSGSTSQTCTSAAVNGQCSGEGPNKGKTCCMDDTGSGKTCDPGTDCETVCKVCQ